MGVALEMAPVSFCASCLTGLSVVTPFTAKPGAERPSLRPMVLIAAVKVKAFGA